MLNRKQHPEYKTIEQIDIPVPEKISLANGSNIFIFNTGTQEIIKIEVIFDAGSWYQEKPFVSASVNEMLLEGTKMLNAQQIAEKLDFYGAFMQPAPTKDHGSITLYTLKKYFPKTIELLAESIKKPVFPEHELGIYKNKRKQQFIIEMEKVTSLARREFNARLFGEKHPYGYIAEADDYDKLNQADLLNFHKKYYHPGTCKIIISGKVSDADIKLTEQHFGQNDWIKQTDAPKLQLDYPINSQNEYIVEKEDVTQTAIRIGKIIINKEHPDFHKLNVVNTILGGYFGSRLMKVIREEKGYTYGINSVIVSLTNVAFFVIVSEVGADVARDAVHDIEHEIKILREKPVTKGELTIVKNYMLGDILRSFDGPLEISSAYRSIIDIDLNPGYFHQAINAIKEITPEEIILLANKYLNETSFIKTFAGKYE